jgi:hypothetical protein
MAPIRFRLRTLMLVITAAAVLMFLARVRAQMNAFFAPIPLFDVSVFAGVVLGAAVGFVLVWVRYASVRTGNQLEPITTTKSVRLGGRSISSRFFFATQRMRRRSRLRRSDICQSTWKRTS